MTFSDLYKNKEKVKAFGLITGNPITVFSPGEYLKVNANYLEGVNFGVDTGTYSSMGTQEKPLTHEDLKACIGSLLEDKNKIRRDYEDKMELYSRSWGDITLGSTNGCDRHGKLPDHKVKLLKYRLQFQGKLRTIDPTRLMPPCITCQAIDAGLLKPKK